MNSILENTRGLRVLFEANMDRFLAPLLIVAAMLLAGWLISLVVLV